MEHPDLTETALHVHLQNLGNKKDITLSIKPLDDLTVTKIGLWNDCIITERDNDTKIYKFHKRTPELPNRPWQTEVAVRAAAFANAGPATITMAITDPDGKNIDDSDAIGLALEKLTLDKLAVKKTD